MWRAGRIVRCIWAACLLLGTANHARIVFRHGLGWDYGGVHWASAAYWSSLTLLDPLVAILLFARPRVGIPATILLIVTNVVHNLAVTARYAPDGAFLTRVTHPIILCQVGFMLLVLTTARTAWKSFDAGRGTVYGWAHPAKARP
jgi:hypothetical protein